MFHVINVIIVEKRSDHKIFFLFVPELTFQVLGVSEGLDVSNLVQGAVIPPVVAGQISAARGLQDDEDSSCQHPQPAEPEHHQQCPAGPHPAEKQDRLPKALHPTDAQTHLSGPLMGMKILFLLLGNVCVLLGDNFRFLTKKPGSSLGFLGKGRTLFPVVFCRSHV